MMVLRMSPLCSGWGTDSIGAAAMLSDFSFLAAPVSALLLRRDVGGMRSVCPMPLIRIRSPPPLGFFALVTSGVAVSVTVRDIPLVVPMNTFHRLFGDFVTLLCTEMTQTRVSGNKTHDLLSVRKSFHPP